MTQNIIVFTHPGLDGAGCVLALNWAFPTARIQQIICSIRDFRTAFLDFTTQKVPDSFDHIFICDLNAINENADICDRPNVHLIEHQPCDENAKLLYTHAKITNTIMGSVTKLVYKTLCPPTLTDAQKHLILLVDDYDSYQLKLKQSDQLNTVFFAMRGDKVDAFCEQFKNGFSGFTAHQQNIIKFHELKIQTLKDELKPFTASITIEAKPRNVLSAFAEYGVNELADHLIKNHNADIAIIVNLNSNRVTFRKKKECEVDLGRLAEKLTKGGGYSHAASGTLTPEFQMFSKVFKPI